MTADRAQFRRSTSLILGASLANRFDGTRHNPRGKMMSEKLDGVRALWDGQQLRSRNGGVFDAPRRMLAALPATMPLDGELFCGRGWLHEALSAVRQPNYSEAWDRVVFCVFDAPMIAGNFRARVTAAAEWLRDFPPCIRAVYHIDCQDRAHLDDYFGCIIRGGGEGVVLRDPLAPHKAGRSDAYLKHKPADID
jgi:DNA ligase-1